jgi:hypothetical protein
METTYGRKVMKGRYNLYRWNGKRWEWHSGPYYMQGQAEDRRREAEEDSPDDTFNVFKEK